MRRALRGTTCVLAWALASGPAVTRADDRNRDARARHDRAASSSRPRDHDRSSRGWTNGPRAYAVPCASYATPCPTPGYGPLYAPVGWGAGARAVSGPEAEAPASLTGELWFEGFASPGSIGGLGGLVLRTQQGWGGGLSLGGAVLGSGPRRLGVAFALDVAMARVLSAQPIQDPDTVTYSSTLDVFAVEVEVGPEYRRRFDALELVLGVGLGLTAVRAQEQFSDGLALREALTVGGRARPYLRLESPREAAWGSVFGELGAAVFVGQPTEYEADYDSLISGLSAFNLTPRARLGYLFPLASGVGLGVAWEGRLFGVVQSRRALAQRILLTLRFGG